MIATFQYPTFCSIGKSISPFHIRTFRCFHFRWLLLLFTDKNSCPHASHFKFFWLRELHWWLRNWPYVEIAFQQVPQTCSPCPSHGFHPYLRLLTPPPRNKTNLSANYQNANLLCVSAKLQTSLGMKWVLTQTLILLWKSVCLRTISVLLYPMAESLSTLVEEE